MEISGDPEGSSSGSSPMTMLIIESSRSLGSHLFSGSQGSQGSKKDSCLVSGFKYVTLIYKIETTSILSPLEKFCNFKLQMFWRSGRFQKSWKSQATSILMNLLLLGQGMRIHRYHMK